MPPIHHADVITNQLDVAMFSIIEEREGVPSLGFAPISLIKIYSGLCYEPAQENIEKIDQCLRIQPLRGGNLLYVT